MKCEIRIKSCDCNSGERDYELTLKLSLSLCCFPIQVINTYNECERADREINRSFVAGRSREKSPRNTTCIDCQALHSVLRPRQIISGCAQLLCEASVARDIDSSAAHLHTSLTRSILPDVHIAAGGEELITREAQGHRNFKPHRLDRVYCAAAIPRQTAR